MQSETEGSKLFGLADDKKLLLRSLLDKMDSEEDHDSSFYGGVDLETPIASKSEVFTPCHPRRDKFQSQTFDSTRNLM